MLRDVPKVWKSLALILDIVTTLQLCHCVFEASQTILREMQMRCEPKKLRMIYM